MAPAAAITAVQSACFWAWAGGTAALAGETVDPGEIYCCIAT
jgi:hypothetical protein